MVDIFTSMVELSTLDLVAGVFTFSTIFLGYVMALITLKKYVEKRSTLLFLSFLLFIGLVSPWLGVSTVFLVTVFNWGAIDNVTYVFMYSWAVPLSATTWNYITAALLTKRPKIKYYVLGLFLVLDALFLYAIYVAKTFAVHQVAGSIFVDSEYQGLAAILIYLYVISILFFVSPLYLYTSMKTDSPLFKIRTRFIGIGAVLYSLVAIIDGVVGISNITILIIVRGLLLITIVMLYLAYTTPQWFTEKFSD